jgi:hypothetical protein
MRTRTGRRGNFTVIVRKDCEIASTSPGNDAGELLDNDDSAVLRLDVRIAESPQARST